MKVHGLLRGLLFAILAAILLCLIGLFVMWLWNWLIPPIFGGREIGFLQALGLLALCRILVGGIRGGRGRRWRARWVNRWEQMSPEERERFRAGIDTRCGGRRVPL